MNTAAAVPRGALPSVRFRRRAIVLSAASASIVAALVFMNANPLAVVRDFHFIVNLVSQMVPPNFALLWRKASMWGSLVRFRWRAATLGGAGIALWRCRRPTRRIAPSGSPSASCSPRSDARPASSCCWCC